LSTCHRRWPARRTRRLALHRKQARVEGLTKSAALKVLRSCPRQRGRAGPDRDRDARSLHRERDRKAGLVAGVRSNGRQPEEIADAIVFTASTGRRSSRPDHQRNGGKTARKSSRQRLSREAGLIACRIFLRRLK